MGFEILEADLRQPAHCDAVVRLIDAYAADYRRVLEALRDGRIDADRVAALEHINGDLDSLLGSGEA